MKRILFALLFIPALSHAYMLIPMDDLQANHLKAYGVAYFALERGVQVKWLLNYRGGSFLVTVDDPAIVSRAISRNVTYETIGGSKWGEIQAVIQHENMNIVDLDVAPKIAVYSPPWTAPWDDAVTLVMQYAEIPYTRIWDEEVLAGQLTKDNFDWIHLHHEDFTGQHGKFWMSFGTAPWYIARVAQYEEIAHNLGFATVQEEKKAVAAKILQYVLDGGFLFAMCAATDSLDIALATMNIDIIPKEIDGTPYDSAWRSKIDYTSTIAFENFSLVTDPYIYEFSDIDIDVNSEGVYYTPFYIKLNEFSAKYDVIPTMLVQNHRNLIKGFLGQTTGFHIDKIKRDVTILDTVEGRNWVTYIHGNRGKGTFTFFAGHDPEDYAHQVGEPPTQLDLFPNSPGYRIILNNVLFPAANTEQRRT